MIRKYRKKPVEIEAMQYKGQPNLAEVLSFIKGEKVKEVFLTTPSSTFTIDTLEGQMKAQLNDFIIKGVKGEFYACKPDIFELTYEQVNQ